MRRNYLFHSFFLATFIFLLVQFGLILVPFAAPILGAVVLWILANPLHDRLQSAMPARSKSFISALSTLIVVALIVGPFIALCWVLMNESQAMAPVLKGWGQALESWRGGEKIFEARWIRSLESTFHRVLGVGRLDFERLAAHLGTEFFGMVQRAGSQVARNTVLFILDLIVIVLSVFFLFRDGENLFMQIYHLIPMRAAHKDRLVEKLKHTVKEIVRGSIVTAFFQTLCAMLGYMMAGIPGGVTLGVATGLASFVPLVGTAIVWLPLGLILLTQDQVGKGLFILVWGAVVVSTFDNLLRTLFIGKKAQLPFLFLFFGILGGLHLYGVTGLLIGPLLVAVIPVFVDIYRQHYLRSTPEPPDVIDDIE